MEQLLTFLAIAIVLPLGTLAICAFFTPGEATSRSTSAEPGPPEGTSFSNLTPAVARSPLSTIPKPAVVPPAAPIASKPPLVSAAQSAPQAEWTSACDDACAALVGMKISKRTAIDLIRRSTGTTVDEILRAALRIHGLSRTQMPTLVNGHAVDANTPTQVAPASSSVQTIQSEAIRALVGLGISSKTAIALVQSCSGNTTEELLRQALKALPKNRGLGQAS
jgi:hypothetical protein